MQAGEAVWDISSSVPNSALDPGATSNPFSLKFYYTGGRDKDCKSNEIPSFNARVFAVAKKPVGKPPVTRLSWVV